MGCNHSSRLEVETTDREETSTARAGRGKEAKSRRINDLVEYVESCAAAF